MLGIRPGWRCWEVGSGGASVPAWLAEQAGADGFVLATDIDPSWVDGVAPAGVEVRRHDVAQDDPAEGGFDLVHARLVLTHVPAERIHAGFVALLVDRGVDRRFARTLPASMRALGSPTCGPTRASRSPHPATAALEIANIQ